VDTCFDAGNVPGLPGNPPREEEVAWMYVKGMLVVLIDETRAADESMRTYVTDDGELVDWLAAASLASSCPVNKSSSDVADEEIDLWRMRLQALPSHKNPLTEMRRASSVVPLITLLERKDFAVLATSAVPGHIHRETMGLEGGVYLYHKTTPPPNLCYSWLVFEWWSRILPQTKLFRHGFD